MKATLLGGAAASLLTFSASAADLGVRPAPLQPVIPPFTWTSCYGGVQAGGGWGKKDLTDTIGIFSGITGYSSTSVDVTGYMVGGQIGCDYQFAPTWVVGIEGAATGGNISKTTNFAVPSFVPPDTASFRSTTDFLASITGRIGYAWDRWLIYGKGGVALVGDRYHADDVQGFTFSMQPRIELAGPRVPASSGPSRRNGPSNSNTTITASALRACYLSIP
jgi:outer membrane immunogenic protein